MSIVASSTVPSPPNGASGNRFWRFALLVLAAAECAPFWAFQYFPSQDGPSHLDNALVSAHYVTELLYRQYYLLTPLQPAGNMFTQFVLAALLQFTTPLLAEKLLLTSYVILLFISFRYLLGALTQFLHTIVLSDHLILAKAVATALIITLLFVLGIAFWQRQYNWSSTGVLTLSLICAIIAVVGPDCVGSGAYIHQRVAMYAWLFFVVWLASALANWPHIALNIIAMCFCGITLIVLVASIPVLSSWNEKLSEVVLVGQNITPRSTVLMVNLQRPKGEVNPYLHAIGLLSPRIIIDMGNCEASTDYFGTQFQPERSPFPALGTVKQVLATPPVFDTRRYERETHGRVDYLLFQRGSDSGDGRTIEDLVDALYRDQIATYSLVPMPAGQHGHLRLYQRTAVDANNSVGSGK